MIVLLSSAKTLDASSPWQAPTTTLPEYLGQAQALVASLRGRTAKDLARLMGVSAKIAQLNAERYRQFAVPFSPTNAKPALLVYQGDVYRAMKAVDFSAEELMFAQQTLRIVSGLFGVLRPLDLIQAYRLEMATGLAGPRWNNLYDFWSERVTRSIDRDSVANGRLILNLASQEYVKVLRPEQLKSAILTITFKQDRRGRVEMVPILAKRARGLMARYLVVHRVSVPERLKAFQDEGYRFELRLSTDQEWTFVRKA